MYSELDFKWRPEQSNKVQGILILSLHLITLFCPNQEKVNAYLEAVKILFIRFKLL